jgi:hypothetical protein
MKIYHFSMLFNLLKVLQGNQRNQMENTLNINNHISKVYLNFLKNISPILTTKRKLKSTSLTNKAFQIISLNILIKSFLTFLKQ